MEIPQSHDVQTPIMSASSFGSWVLEASTERRANQLERFSGLPFLKTIDAASFALRI
jgi:hypothetical protein